MVDFALTDEQLQFQRLAHDFAEKEIRPVAALYDEKDEFPWDVVKKAAKMGLTSFYFPEKYGGGGVEDRVTEFIVSEELAWGCAGIQTCILGTGLAAAGILAIGTEEQKDKWIPMFCDENNLKIGAMCLTEPNAGSDVQSLSTTAVAKDGGYLINGVKCFITNGGIADVHVVFATTDPAAGWGGLAAFIVPKGTAGMSMGKKEHKLGVRASHTAEVIFQDCWVPAENRLGGEGAIAALGALQMLEYTRPGVGAAALGIARAALEYAIDYAKTRVQFRKPIIAHQGIGFKLADMATKVEAARLLIWKAGWMCNVKAPFNKGEGSMAKLYAGDIAVEVCIDAVQVLGGYGYMKEYPVEKWLRDSKIYQIWEGTAEIQRLVIARKLGGKSF
jgi:alkylation response protein AidB-like acyl-CoA dehydrogenase